MGLFYRYTNDGAGIDKNGPKKRGFFLFFEILFRKIWEIMKSSMIYFIASLPLLVIYYFLAFPIVYNMTASWEMGADSSTITTAFSLFFSSTVAILLGSGPASAALAYIHRSFSREEHVWIFSDFKKKFKENFKQGMIVTITDTLIMAVGLFVIGFYYNYYMQNQQIIWFVAMFFLLILLVVFVLMHQYIYQLMVTFENKLLDIYKNAFLLTLSTMASNVLLTALIVALSFCVFLSITPEISVFIAFFGLVGIMRFMLEFHASRVIQKNILKNIKPEETKSSQEELAENIEVEE